MHSRFFQIHPPHSVVKSAYLHIFFLSLPKKYADQLRRKILSLDVFPQHRTNRFGNWSVPDLLLRHFSDDFFRNVSCLVAEREMMFAVEDFPSFALLLDVWTDRERARGVGGGCICLRVSVLVWGWKIFVWRNALFRRTNGGGGQ